MYIDEFARCYSAPGAAGLLSLQVLGLSKDCSDRDVTRAYRKQVSSFYITYPVCVRRRCLREQPHDVVIVQAEGKYAPSAACVVLMQRDEKRIRGLRSEPAFVTCVMGC